MNGPLFGHAVKSYIKISISLDSARNKRVLLWSICLKCYLDLGNRTRSRCKWWANLDTEKSEHSKFSHMWTTQEAQLSKVFNSTSKLGFYFLSFFLRSCVCLSTRSNFMLNLSVHPSFSFVWAK